MSSLSTKDYNFVSGEMMEGKHQEQVLFHYMGYENVAQEPVNMKENDSTEGGRNRKPLLPFTP